MTSNVRGLTFATAEAAFLAGYRRRAVSEPCDRHLRWDQHSARGGLHGKASSTGAVYYDSIRDHDDGSRLESRLMVILHPATSTQDRRAYLCQNLMDEGADVILPVAGGRSRFVIATSI